MVANNLKDSSIGMKDTPIIKDMRVIPVAGRDSMLLNLSGAHGPFFTRNIVILEDNAGRLGAGEVPGGEKIRQTLDDASALIVGRPIGEFKRILKTMRDRYADRDVGGRGAQTYDLRVAVLFFHHSRLQGGYVKWIQWNPPNRSEF